MVVRERPEAPDDGTRVGTCPHRGCYGTVVVDGGWWRRGRWVPFHACLACGRRGFGKPRAARVVAT